MLNKPLKTDPLSIIMKLPGETCNINCLYCYEKRKPYPNAKYLDYTVVASLIKVMDGRPLSIELHGGEPLLLGQEKIRAILVELRKYSGPVKISMQTNGILLDESWIDFFEQEWPDIEIGISLDGDPSANSYRVDYQNNPTYLKVEKTLNLLSKMNKKIGVISVITKDSLTRANEILTYFKNFSCIKSLKFAPCLDYNVKTKKHKSSERFIEYLNPEGKGRPGWATSPMEYADFICEVFDIWEREKLFNNFVIEPVLSVIKKKLGIRTAFCHFSNMKCAHVLTLYPDGRIGSCDELSMPNSYLTHINELKDINDIIMLQTNKKLDEELNNLLKKCQTCSYYETCGGGCLATRSRYAGTDFDDEYCDYRIKMIDYIGSSIERKAVKDHANS
ncbi:radical SAM/SPASM domain-containing protein [Bacillus cereus]|uniref:radical SAM/SPASM domain-containing protein n=1 Tax=Bacillus cereus TaxID=1396 RepID=UPI0009441A61|nr:radical SAM protein [Bacillus cereus]